MSRNKKCKKAPERVLFCVLRRWGMQDDIDKMRAVPMHRPRCSIVLFYEYADGIVLLEFCKLFFLPYQ